MPKLASAVRKVALNMKTTPEVRQALEAAAAVSGRCLTEEVEVRLMRSLREDDLPKMLRETVRQEMRAEFDARRADPALVRQLDELCGPAAYQRINGNKADA